MASFFYRRRVAKAEICHGNTNNIMQNNFRIRFTREPVGAVGAATAELLAVVLELHAGAGLVAGTIRVNARTVVFDLGLKI